MLPTNHQQHQYYYHNDINDSYDDNERTQPQQSNHQYQGTTILNNNNQQPFATNDIQFNQHYYQNNDHQQMQMNNYSITSIINSNLMYSQTPTEHQQISDYDFPMTSPQPQPTTTIHNSYLENYYNLQSFGKTKDLIVNSSDPRRTVLENYYPGLVGKIVGEGGYGVVYHVQTNPPLAVKMIEIKNEEHLLTEIQRECSRNLRHPHILTINPDMKWFFNYAIIESEFMKEGSLAKQRGKLKSVMHWQVLHQIASALDYMHKSQFIHRDVKPENILVRSIDIENGIIDVVLSDFGLSRSLETLSSNPLGAGSLLYMAPEQFTAYREITPSSDVFSLGITMINLIANTCLADCKVGIGQQLASESSHPDSHFRRKITWSIADKVSSEMLDLIIGMTRRKASARCSCADIVSHCEKALKSGTAYHSKTFNPISKLIGYSLKQSFNVE